MLKTWIFYIVIVWQIGPLAPEEQKTLILQFDHKAECESIAVQVQQSVKAANSIFSVKQVNCHRCTDIYEERLCATKKVVPKALPPFQTLPPKKA